MCGVWQELSAVGCQRMQDQMKRDTGGAERKHVDSLY